MQTHLFLLYKQLFLKKFTVFQPKGPLLSKTVSQIHEGQIVLIIKVVGID